MAREGGDVREHADCVGCPSEVAHGCRYTFAEQQVAFGRAVPAGVELDPADELSEVGHDLHISAALVRLGWQVEDGDPRSEAFEATIALSKETVKVLRAP